MKDIDVVKRGLGITFNGKAEIRVWSPQSETLSLCLDRKKLPMHKEKFGYWSLATDAIQPGDLYTFLLNDHKELPDPASLSQPGGVHGASQAVDTNEFTWTDGLWKNIPLEKYIIYELHTGTFTREGTFEAIINKLDHFKRLGINAIEIMPVAQFPGGRNWGYDGVYPFAVQNTYGGAKDLQQLVNACHRQGIAVILDVVYNHLGPEGNYLTAYGPYLTNKYKTPWGGAINFDDAWCDGVRHYYIENALLWFRDFHIDALRLDAVHAIKDMGPVHILRQIKEYVNSLMQSTGRTHYMIVELDLNDNRYINPLEESGYGMDAQWVDEFHHALRVTAGGGRHGYYEDFCGIEHLAKAYKDAYVYDGQFSPHRKKTFGIKAENNPGKQFIVFSQNHDQVGNRMLGERTSALHSFEMQKLMAAAVMVSPYLPMLFMGEEWSDPDPFLYFASHTDPALADAIRKGRREEFAAFHVHGEAPDPMAEETFWQSKLRWDLLNDGKHDLMFRYYQGLIALRKQHSALGDPERGQLHVEYNKGWQTLSLQRWTGEEDLICLMNFSKKPQSHMIPSNVQQWQKIWDSACPEWNGPAAAPEEVSGGTPGATAITLQPESVVIYSKSKGKSESQK